MTFRNKGSAGLTVLVVFILLVIVALVIANRWLKEQTGRIVSHPVKSSAGTSILKTTKEQPKRRLTGEVLRKTRFSPDRKYDINIFYQDGEQIARNKTANGKTFDATGKVPDGKVKFFNESDETYGAAYYRDGELHGPSKTFYKDDILKGETYYQYGKPMTRTEYFHDGRVRMEEDYTNAREFTNDPEVGVGKVYFRDGTLKYEWYMVHNDKRGFKKSYNGKGELVSEVYYNEYGQVIPPGAPPVVDDEGLPKEILVPVSPSEPEGLDPNEKF